MKHTPFVLVANMASPLCLREPLHLDGLLLAAREKRSGIRSRGKPFDLLAMAGRVFRASTGLIVTTGLVGVVKKKLTRVRRIDMKGADGEMIYFPPNAKVSERTIGSMSPYRNRMVEDSVYQGVTSVVWQVVGDRDAILELLNDEVRSIGKMHTTGLGKISDFEAYDTDAPEETCGLVADGKPLRNLPIDLAKQLGADVSVTFSGRIEPPYGATEDRIPVTGPVLSDLITITRDAEKFFKYR